MTNSYDKSVTIDGRTINAEFEFPGTAGDKLAYEAAGFAQFFRRYAAGKNNWGFVGEGVFLRNCRSYAAPGKRLKTLLSSCFFKRE